MRIVFMGTPDLAAHCLSKIIDAGYHVVGVVTAPDRPAGRGQRLRQSPVKQLGERFSIPVLQPDNLKSSDFLERLGALAPDLQVVVAFRMLPQVVWSLPPKGTFNMHASLLPDYRGAAPINWVLINGESETGVTTFMLDHKVDTGQILFRERLPVEAGETAGSLHEKMKGPAADIIIKTIETIEKGFAKPMPQSAFHSEQDVLHKAPKIFREDCRIEWSKPGQQIVNLIRGLSPVPGAFCDIDDVERSITMKIYEASATICKHDHLPGTVLTDNKEYLHIATPDGVVKILELQLSGKKAMKTHDLLRGFQFKSPVKYDC